LLYTSKEKVVSDLSTTRPAISSAWLPGRLVKAIAGRLRGPGGYYNVGNLIGLAAALATQLATAPQGSAPHGGIDAIIGYFAGSPAAVALTAATIIFLVSGETYHRAWAGRSVPDAALNQFADVLSAVGSLALAVSLVFVGQWPLAVASGLLSVGGKLGSALFGDDSSLFGFWPVSWIDPFRGAVLVGRLPAVAAVGLDLSSHVLNWNDGSLLPIIQSAVLLFCYVLWIKADLLLVAGARATVRDNEEVNHARPS
jgi:hypothetical protein